MDGTIAIKGNLPTTTGPNPEGGLAWRSVRAGPTSCRNTLRRDGRSRGDWSSRTRMRHCMADTAAPNLTGAQPVSPFQTETVQSDSSESAVRGANVWNNRDVGFVSDGNASVNGGSENPGVLHPTKQPRPALRIRTLALRAPAVPGSATVWGVRAETGSGRVRFVHHLGLRFLEHVRTGQSATAVAPPASRCRLQAGRVRPRPGRRKAPA